TAPQRTNPREPSSAAPPQEGRVEERAHQRRPKPSIFSSCFPMFGVRRAESDESVSTPVTAKTEGFNSGVRAVQVRRAENWAQPQTYYAERHLTRWDGSGTIGPGTRKLIANPSFEFDADVGRPVHLARFTEIEIDGRPYIRLPVETNHIPR